MKPTLKARGRAHRWAARTVAIVATAAVATVGLSACSSSSTTSSGDLEKALQTKTTLTVWAWDPGWKPIAEAFHKKYPKITVDLVNAGTGNDQYTKLQNAIKAGTGAPDVAQMEYQAIPQFAISKGLYDLRDVGFESLKSKFTAGAWNDVLVGDAIYGLPQGTGPMALFYNKKVFDAAGITTPPATWEEYAADAEKIHAQNPNAYITNDTGDAGFTTSLIWQAGGQPFRADGTKVTVNLQDAGSKKAADMWSPLIEKGLVAPITTWSDQWYKALADGTVASLTIGGWMAGNLESGVPSGKGDWRVAPMPAFTAGDKGTAENGGGGASVIAQSSHKEVAAEFVKFLAAGPGQKIELDAVGGVPSTVADLDDTTWQNKEWDYFGGQQLNKILADSAKNVVPGWQYLPYQVYANSIFGDTVGTSYTNKTSLNVGLQKWQDALVTYGKQQGFTVSQ